MPNGKPPQRNSAYDLEVSRRDRITPPGYSAYSAQTFAPRMGPRSRGDWDPYDPGPNENVMGQQVSGDSFRRVDPRQLVVRPQTNGNLPAFLVPEAHRELVVHPSYETVVLADGTREFWTVRHGDRICSCGKAHGPYKEEVPELFEPVDGVVVDWPDDMIAMLDTPVQLSPTVEDEGEEDFLQW